jgi:hypothetical protein
MTVKELWAQYQGYTKDLTEHARKLGFAGCAICWLFKTENYTFPSMIYVALLFFVFYFIADILQGLFGAVTVRLFTERQEGKLWKESGSLTGDVHKPRWVDIPACAMFFTKTALLITGFVFIGFELLQRLGV